MSSGFLLYKCRRCNKEISTPHVPNGIIALTCIISNTKMPDEWGCLEPDMTTICGCGDGNLGVADLIGFKEDK